MRINYMSDIHTEFESQAEDSINLTNKHNADVLVLAGDIGVGSSGRFWVQEVASKYQAVIYIAGNHEYYRKKLPDARIRLTADLTSTNLYPEQCVYVPENDTVYVNGTAFHCCTLWTDCDNNPLTIARVDRELNDFRLIRTDGGKSRFTANYSTILHAESVQFLKDNVQPGDVVVTHHAPSFKSMHPCYAYDLELNHAYMSNLEELIQELRPSLWIHGHVHTSFDYKVGDTRVVCNPRGYVNYEENPDFNPNAYIDI